jgi:DNA replication protein DnaC
MEALRAGYLVRYTTIDDLVRELRQADQLGTLRNKLAHYQRPHLLICDEVGYMRLEHGDANRFVQLVNRRYTRSSMIVTSNKRVSEWAELFGDEVQAVAILDRLLQRRRDPHHQRPVVAATRPRRPPPSTPRPRRERRKQPDRYRSATRPRAAEEYT